MSIIHNTTKDKILSILLSNKKEEFTIRSIAHKVNVDYKTVYIVVNQLIKDRAVNAKRAGQTILCSINIKCFNADVFRAETIRKEGLLRKKDMRVMHQYFKDIKEPFFILLIFGSYASGNARKGSDIDLMLISDNKDTREKAKRIASLIPLDIHLLDFSSAEFMSMIKTTEFNVGKEALENNIILYGIEDYYRLVENA